MIKYLCCFFSLYMVCIKWGSCLSLLIFFFQSKIAVCMEMLFQRVDEYFWHITSLSPPLPTSLLLYTIVFVLYYTYILFTCVFPYNIPSVICFNGRYRMGDRLPCRVLLQIILNRQVLSSKIVFVFIIDVFFLKFCLFSVAAFFQTYYRKYFYLNEQREWCEEEKNNLKRNSFGLILIYYTYLD